MHSIFKEQIEKKIPIQKTIRTGIILRGLNIAIFYSDVKEFVPLFKKINSGNRGRKAYFFDYLEGGAGASVFRNLNDNGYNISLGKLFL